MRRIFFALLAATAIVACRGAALAPTPSTPVAATPSSVASAAPRTIAVTLTDEMRIQPDPIDVRSGEAVRFVVTNAGLIVHEVFLGDESEQVEHEEEMRDGAMPHDHRNAVSVAPGETEELTNTFGEAADWIAGCHIPGHYPAGMKATLTIRA